MKALLIEDDQNKSKHIVDFFAIEFPTTQIVLRKSYQSGLKEIIGNSFDFILLDMQLPNFDISSGEDGYRFRKLAGIDILKEIQRKKINCKVIIVTQFETFGEKESYIELADLKKMIREQYKGIYIDSVFYSADKSSWKRELYHLIQNL
ncbi:MAG: response regulator [Sphingobacteriales bacterium]|nr:MAG: response regulator [Sphingobacteriales bacterium]